MRSALGTNQRLIAEYPSLTNLKDTIYSYQKKKKFEKESPVFTNVLFAFGTGSVRLLFFDASFFLARERKKQYSSHRPISSTTY